MNIEVITKEDLQNFRLQLLSDLKELFLSKQTPKREWLRSNEVIKLLKISPGTLQNLRIAGKLRPSKIGGILLYHNADIDKLLNANN